MKKNDDMNSYFGTIEAEPYNTGKDHFIPKHRTIYISGNMYPGTKKDFIYITSDLMGKMRLYWHRDWFETGIGNIFASGKTLEEAMTKFEYKYKNKIYNK